MTELKEQYATLSLGIPDVKGKSVYFYFILSVNICYMMNNEVWSDSAGEINFTAVAGFSVLREVVPVYDRKLH